MKKDIHPTYFPAATVTCACGNKFTVGSTKENPFFTGQEKVMDTAGRVEKFKARQSKATTTTKKKTTKKSSE